MLEEVLAWAPIYDQVVALFVETIEGECPSLETDSSGKPIRNEQGGFSIEGGWPCQRYPDAWPERARIVLNSYQQHRANHKLATKPDRKKENFSRLRDYMWFAISDPTSLGGADVGSIRLILAGIANNRGLPGSPKHTAYREKQVAELPEP